MVHRADYNGRLTASKGQPVIITPKVRGFICTTAHPVGCEKNVEEQIAITKASGAFTAGPKRVLVIGASTGYGLAQDSAKKDMKAAGTDTKTQRSWFRYRERGCFRDALPLYPCAAFQRERRLWACFRPVSLR